MNAQSKIKSEIDDVGTVTPEGYLVKNDKLLKLGNGDLHRGRRWLRLMMADEADTAPRKGPTTKPETVRIASEDDELNILALLIEGITRSAPSWVPVDPETIWEHVILGTRKRGGIVGVVDGPDGKPVAVTVLMIAQPAFSKMKYIHEVFNVVHHDHRRSRHAEDLIKFGNWCSDEWTRNFGFPVHIISTVNTLEGVREKLRFYRRHMTQLGATFTYPTVGK